MLELILPRACGGCGLPGVEVCDECKSQWLAPPQMITTKVDAHIPLWSLGPYGGSRRRALIAIKERGRADLAKYMGAVIDAAVARLVALGHVEHDVVLVAAPTSRASARKRGGDPVARIIAHTRFETAHAVEHGKKVRDSVGLSLTDRRKNMAGGITFHSPKTTDLSGRSVLIVDDVITTGATMAGTALVLTSAGVNVRGGLGWSNA